MKKIKRKEKELTEEINKGRRKVKCLRFLANKLFYIVMGFKNETKSIKQAGYY